MPPPLKRSITISGHRTSISLEPDFWAALQDIAIAKGLSLSALVAAIDDARTQADDKTGLSSAIRTFVLQNYRQPPSFATPRNDNET